MRRRRAGVAGGEGPVGEVATNGAEKVRAGEGDKLKELAYGVG